MSILEAILLGLVQGLTEFLPVSSSGHLTLAQALFGLSGEGDYMLFNVLLHFGTLLSVVVAFWADIRELFFEFFRWIRAGFRMEGQPYRRMLVMLILSVVPMFAILPIKSAVEVVFSSTLAVGCLLCVTAVLLWLSERFQGGRKTAADAKYTDGLIVGVWQCFAVLPGLSRSGTTLVAGLSRGFSREFAVKFAFIMSLPVILGANILEIGEAIATPPVAPVSTACYVAGVVTAMVSGLAAIRLVRLVANRGNFRPFVVYCAAIGVLTIVVSLVQTIF